ncbi:MAG: ABC transporter ATP-binding protein [Phyllobacteriaceae bacterium]|nr:ABC transporter ATP-binding protein [Phyllobacteriaceae bacterium]
MTTPAADPRSAAAPLLSVDGLRLEFHTRRGVLTAIDGIDFDVAPGEVLGLVGESGAGKSLTGAALIGLLDPACRLVGGTIRLAGERIDHLPPDALRHVRGRRIGMIFQDPLTSLNPLITIGDQLVETIRIHMAVDAPTALERAVRLLEDVGIPAARERIHNYPHQFSGGMRQRVVIALALACDPELIIADEPTTALDVSVQAQIITLLKNLCRDKGTAVILITHDMGVIAEIADRVAVLYAGRLVEIGAVQKIISAPLHPYTRGLMGAIPTLDGERDRLVQIPGAMPQLSAIPAGCAFHPRCSQASARCVAERPVLHEADGVRAACFVTAPAPLDAPPARPPTEVRP